MKDKESDSRDPESLIKQLKENLAYRGSRITAQQKHIENLQTEVKRLKGVAEENWKMFLDTHNALNLLNQDAQTALRESGAWELHLQLTEVREDYEKLRDKSRKSLQLWKDLTSKAVANKTAEAQKARDLEELVGQLRERLEEVEKQRDEVEKNAKGTIARYEERLSRIADQCKLWRRGELDTMTTIAGIDGEVRGYPLPEPGAWEREKAVRAAEILSQHREMAVQLADIEELLTNSGVDLVDSHVNQVRELIRLFGAQRDEIDEWKLREAIARGAITRLAKRFHCGDKVTELLTKGDYDGAFAVLDNMEGGNG